MSGRRRRTDEAPAEELPQPPPAPRRLRLRWTQVVGMLLVIAAPALALAGLLDGAEQTVSVVSVDQGIGVRVRYPTRMRYRTNQWLVIEVQNRGPTAQDRLAVLIDPVYMQSFNPISVVPEPRQAFNFALEEVPAGQSRQVMVFLQAERYGRRPGWVRVQPSRGAAVQLPLKTLVLW